MIVQRMKKGIKMMKPLLLLLGSALAAGVISGHYKGYENQANQNIANKISTIDKNVDQEGGLETRLNSENSYANAFFDIENIKESVVCLRTTARYSGSDQKWFGTGFAYMERDGFVYFVTNYHVAVGEKELASFFSVLEKESKDNVEIVDNMYDDFKKDDIKLEFVVGNKRKDIAILRVKKEEIERYNKLVREYNSKIKDLRRRKKRISVYKGHIGDSNNVRSGDKVILFGVPLAIYSAIAEGVVSNPRIFDAEPRYGWWHWDIVVDAAVNPGNSGSPLFKVDKVKGYVWIGQIHAGYFAEGMKHAIAINEFKDLLFKLKEDKGSLSEEQLKSVFEYAKKKDQLGNLVKFFDLHCLISADEDKKRLKIKFFTEGFPYELREALELIDYEKNKLGSLDEIVLHSKEGTKIILYENLPDGVKDTAEEFYKALAEMLDVATKIKAIAAGKEYGLYEHEQLKLRKTLLKILESENKRLFEDFKNAIKEHADENKAEDGDQGDNF